MIHASKQTGIRLLLWLFPLLSPFAQAAMQWQECSISHPRLSTLINAHCVDLQLPLDHHNPNGPTIRLHLARVAAKGPKTQQDPVFFFAGGPGQSATRTALTLWGVLGKLRQQRDLILMDQRGSGDSTPLNCPQDERLDLNTDDAALAQQVRDCLQRQQVDVRYFTTAQSVADVEWVRNKLGYAQINLIGVSYGTRLAQLYLKTYPQAVRAMVLDGVLPLQTLLGPDFSHNLMASIEAVLGACRDDINCQKAFPTLQQDWHDYLQLALHDKRKISIRHPRTGKLLKLNVSRENLDAALRFLSYSSESQALIPLLLHLTTNDNWRPMLSQALRIATSLSDEISAGLNYSVICTEDVPYYPAKVPPSTRPLGRFMAQMRIICNHWPHQAEPSPTRQAFRSDVPVLLLSGQLDPVTPPAYGETALQQFPRGIHLVVPGQGHNVLPRGCLSRLASDFLRHLKLPADAKQCIRKTSRLPFFIDTLGPAA